jgi:plastocyanin
MTRAKVGLFVLGMVAALTLALETASIAHGAPAPEGECTWHRHSKRVVEHVRRHGRVRAVKRAREWWTCDPASPPETQPAAAPSLPGTAPVVEPTPAPPPPSRLGVKAVEWSYTMSRPEVTAGEVTIELDNEGEDPHNLRLQLEGSSDPPLEVPQTAASERSTAHFNLPAGTYRLYCSLYSHDKKGMHATLVVNE